MPPMSRTKSRPSTDVCADCSAPDPTWVSVNRAIFLCTECCSVHRSLGRHISQIKPLYKSVWIPTQLQMVFALNNSGVNSVWEHALFDPNTKNSMKKPLPKDPLHPVKSEFIQLKHAKLAWTLRGPKADGFDNGVNELGQQLHASARSSNLHTSVRLLAQGADPNYFHDEKGSAPLHVAAKSNQIHQAELLLIYGADPCKPDALGRTPVESAKQAGHLELADRLLDACYELTDRLTRFLCGRGPDHRAGQHLLVPDVKEVNTSVLLHSRLQMLSNHLFDEFAIDVFDEVDRRETESVWQSTQGGSSGSDRGSVLFLPVQPKLSTTRNQARQKLGRLGLREFNAVVLDVLTDARRRQHTARFTQYHDAASKITGRSDSSSKHFSHISDDEPLYDSVASDDDYAALAPVKTEHSTHMNISVENNSSTVNKEKSSPEENNITIMSDFNDSSKIVSNSQLADKLRQSDSKITELREEVNALRALVERLSLENCDLRSKLNNPIDGGSSVFNSDLGCISSTSGFNSIGEISLFNNTSQNTSRAFGSDNLSNGNGHGLDMVPVQDVGQGTPRSQRPASMFEARERDWQPVKQQKEDSIRPAVTQSLYHCDKSVSPSNQSLSEEVNKRTNNVTKQLQKLWNCIQKPGRKDCAVPCAELIRVAVADLTAVVPQNNYDEVVRSAVRQLITSTARLQIECASLQRASSLAETSQTEKHLHLVSTCAYDIAKATKILITVFQK